MKDRFCSRMMDTGSVEEHKQPLLSEMFEILSDRYSRMSRCVRSSVTKEEARADSFKYTSMVERQRWGSWVKR